MKPEDNYPKYMEEHVLPYLLPRREEQYLEREAGKKIYCAFYTAEHAKGIILISHGFTESADKYFEVIYHFLRAGYHVCIPEHCGHGRTYRLVDGDLSLVHVDSWQRYADDLRFVALAAKRRWTQDSNSLPLFLFAHSMGGGIGAALTAEEPHLFSRVILSSPMIRPLTGPVPWTVTKAIVAAMCAAGRQSTYVIGQHAYNGKETVETSCASSAARYAWYKAKTDAEPLFQMNGASYGWLREAIRLNHFLMDSAWKMMEDPVLLIQAEQDNIVSKDEQVKFIRKLAKARKAPETAASVYGGGKDDVSRKHSLASASGQVAQSMNAGDVRFVRIAGAKHEIFRSDDATVEKFLRGCLEFYNSSPFDSITF